MPAVKPPAHTAATALMCHSGALKPRIPTLGKRVLHLFKSSPSYLWKGFKPSLMNALATCFTSSLYSLLELDMVNTNYYICRSRKRPGLQY